MPRTLKRPPELTTALTELPIDNVRPYWRNPRNVTDADIDKVAASIERYGYQAPIIVDRNHVIIAGHTRYMAMRRLGMATVDVIVSELDERKAQEYRLIDNRSGEFSGWDRDLLLAELRDFDTEVVDLYFPAVDLELEELDFEALVPPPRTARPVIEPQVLSQTATCPYCFHAFEVPDAPDTDDQATG